MSWIGKSIGNYQIKSKLGEGGMGAVYLGEHPLIGKKVAIKVLLPELSAKEDIVNRFFHEAKAVNDIGHPNIVDIVDFGKMRDPDGGSTDTVYFIMEYLDGQSLQQRLRSTGMSFPETVKVISECCSALAASHKKGIVHRDLKPENIYLCPRGSDKNFAKLLDFGIAKLTGDGATSSKTRTGLVIGTPAYMSPEQCEGKGNIDSRSDIYSLGVVMYELLTGRVPFVSEGYGDILVAHLTRQPDPPATVNPSVPPELDAIVMHALEKDKNRRFQTMEEFQQALANPAAHYTAYKQLPAPSQPAGAKHSGSTMYLDPNAPLPPEQPRQPVTAQGRAPTPTTLSQAAGEMGPSGRSRAPLFVSFGITLLLAGGGVVWFVTQKGNGPAKVAAQENPAPPIEQPKDDSVLVTIHSTPPGAKIVRAGVGEIGVTPFDIKVKRGEPSFDVQLKLDGYRSQVKEVKTEKETLIDVTLEKIAEPTPPPQPVPQVVEKPEVKEPVVKVEKKKREKKKKEDQVDPDVGLMKPKFLE